MESISLDDPELINTAAWLLLSIDQGSSNGGIPLERVLGVADAINKGVPHAQELAASISMLIQANLVRSTPPVFEITPAAKEVIEHVRLQHASDEAFCMLIAPLAQQIHSPLRSALLMPQPTTSLTTTEADLAITRYRERMFELINASLAQHLSTAQQTKPPRRRLLSSLLSRFGRNPRHRE